MEYRKLQTGLSSNRDDTKKKTTEFKDSARNFINPEYSQFKKFYRPRIQLSLVKNKPDTM